MTLRLGGGGGVVGRTVEYSTTLTAKEMHVAVSESAADSVPGVWVQMDDVEI